MYRILEKSTIVLADELENMEAVDVEFPSRCTN
jgi:hypothetical protein